MLIIPCLLILSAVAIVVILGLGVCRAAGEADRRAPRPPGRSAGEDES